MLPRHRAPCHLILLPALLLFLLPPGLSQSTNPPPPDTSLLPSIFGPAGSPIGLPPSPSSSSPPQPTQPTQPSTLAIPTFTAPVGAPVLPLVVPAPKPAAGASCPLTFSPSLLSSASASCTARCQPSCACCTGVNGYVFDAQAAYGDSSGYLALNLNAVAACGEQIESGFRAKNVNASLLPLCGITDQTLNRTMCWDTVVNLERSVSASTRSQLVQSCSAADSAIAAAPTSSGMGGGGYLISHPTSCSVCSQMVQIALSEAGRDISCVGTLFVYVAIKAAKSNDRAALLNLATCVTTLQNFNLSSCSGSPSGFTPPSPVIATINSAGGSPSKCQSWSKKHRFNKELLLLMGAVFLGLLF